MNELLVMFLFTVFMLSSFIVIGFSLKNQIIVILVVVFMFMILVSFAIYMNYIIKLATKKLKETKDFDSLKLFLNYILTSKVDLKLYIDKETAMQIIKILNNEIYSVKDIHIYNVLDGKYNSKHIRAEILEELEYLINSEIYNYLIDAYEKLASNNYDNSDILLVSLDTWCIQQLMYIRNKQTSKVEEFQYEALLNIIDNIDGMKIQV